MITLTTPIQVPSTLGSSATTAYNKLRIVSANADPVSQGINAQVQLMVSSNAVAPIIYGTLSIVTTGGGPVCNITIPTLNFYIGISLTGPQVTAVQGWIASLQNSVEAGLISIAAVSGTQSNGV